MKSLPPIPSRSNENFCFHVEDYSFGFNGKDKESEFNNGAYDFGARIHDARLGRWMSVDPEFRFFSCESTYSSIRNNPIICIDQNGMKWINYFDKLVQEKQSELLQNPDSGRLKRQLKRLEAKQSAVNLMIQELKSKDLSLYNYIENLTVIDPKTMETLDVNVIVSIDNASNAPRRTPSSGPADGVTRYVNRDTKLKMKSVYYDSLESEAIQWSDNKCTAIPAPFITGSDEIGFRITIYSVPVARVPSLANEVGDVMYRMEYPDAAIKQGGNENQTEDEYRNSGSGDYSFDVEETFETRRDNGQGADPNSNPYPLKKD
jgi:RHS repeat-associated protein